MNAAQFSRGLGWFSIGLGMTELLAPRAVARAIGVSEDHDRLLRTLGAREIVSGLGLLARPKPTGFAWSRVAGDIMDLSLLGAALTQVRSQPMLVSRSQDDDRRRLTFAIAVVVGVTLVDVMTSARLTRPTKPDPRWRFNPPGGRSGLRRPIEVDRPQDLRFDDQRPSRARRRESEIPTSSLGHPSTESNSGQSSQTASRENQEVYSKNITRP